MSVKLVRGLKKLVDSGFFTKLLEFELMMFEKEDASALAGIHQVITRKP